MVLHDLEPKSMKYIKFSDHAHFEMVCMECGVCMVMVCQRKHRLCQREHTKPQALLPAGMAPVPASSWWFLWFPDGHQNAIERC